MCYFVPFLHLKHGLTVITTPPDATGLTVSKCTDLFGTPTWTLIIPLFAQVLTYAFSGQQIHLPKLIDVNKLVTACVTIKKLTELGSRLATITP